MFRNSKSISEQLGSLYNKPISKHTKKIHYKKKTVYKKNYHHEKFNYTEDEVYKKVYYISQEALEFGRNAKPPREYRPVVLLKITERFLYVLPMTTAANKRWYRISKNNRQFIYASKFIKKKDTYITYLTEGLLNYVDEDIPDNYIGRLLGTLEENLRRDIAAWLKKKKHHTARIVVDEKK